MAATLAGCNQNPAAKVKETADKVSDAAKSASEALGKDFEAATKKAASALEGVAGGPEMLKDLTGLFGSAQKTISGVTSVDTARAAAPGLDSLLAKIVKPKLDEFIAKLNALAGAK